MQHKLEQIVPSSTPLYQQIVQYYDFCEHVRGLSPVTLTSKRYIINDFLRHLAITSLEQLTDQMVYDWISHQSARGNTGRSINDRLAHIKAMLRWQQEMNLRMPYLHLALITKVNEAPPRKVYFTRAEVCRVLS